MSCCDGVDLLCEVEAVERHGAALLVAGAGEVRFKRMDDWTMVISFAVSLSDGAFPEHLQAQAESTNHRRRNVRNVG